MTVSGRWDPGTWGAGRPVKTTACPTLPGMPPTGAAVVRGRHVGSVAADQPGGFRAGQGGGGLTHNIAVCNETVTLISQTGCISLVVGVNVQVSAIKVPGMIYATHG